MKKLALALLCVAATVASSPAANIAFVSFHGADDAPSANAATAGFTQAPDVGYTQLLTANGHTVTRFLSKDLPTAADATAYNGFDLVIISRSTPSGHYQQNEEAAFWNTMITKPVINLGAYGIRNSRLGWLTGGTIPDTATDISLTVANSSHPIFAGVTLGAGNVTASPFAGIASFNATTQRGISTVIEPPSNGNVLATVADAADPAFGGAIIAEWSAGAVMANATASVLAGPRLMFLTGSREASGLTSEGAGIYDLTPIGQTMFLNAVTYMAVVPEPSTYALLGLGALALLMRWRKS
jgi:hypothetical protein